MQTSRIKRASKRKSMRGAGGEMGGARFSDMLHRRDVALQIATIATVNVTNWAIKIQT